MCGRYGFGNPARLGTLPLGVTFPALAPRYNVAPSQAVPLVLQEGDIRELRMAKWGLIPFWAEDPGIGHKLANARADGIAAKPAFRAAFKKQRGLMPADLFYEWQVVPGHQGKQPWCIRLPDDEPFVMAALWDHWQPRHDPIADPMLTCCIITTDANATMEPIHHRMPVILPLSDVEAWLDPETAPADAARLLRPYVGPLHACQVKTWVNATRNDDAQCAAPMVRSDAHRSEQFFDD
ncbi:SOS response-associated peptidase [Gemmatimonas sp.]|uniref:SOS response-associated peptidase n=1 Tax=Gemmatimonas sp. TaxID=1962908 RepID=UPI003567E41E